MEKNLRDTMDRISKLPEPVVHHILSFLDSPVELVRMSVLSKKWFALTASFPIFDFNIDSIDKIMPPYWFNLEHRPMREKFLKYVDYTISRFCEQNVSAYSFKLMTVLDEPIHVDIVDRWIGKIVGKNVQKLNLYIITSCGEPQYCLPNTLFCATGLMSLTIHFCELPSSLMVDGVKFKSLKKLSLHGVPVDDGAIKFVTSSFPLLEKIKVVQCPGLKSFCVKGLQNLQKVKIRYGYEFERIDMEAPNLQSLCLIDPREILQPYINVTSCQKLTTLSLEIYDCVESDRFADFLSNFPFIEYLSLYMLNHSDNKKLKFSSHLLRNLVLSGWCNLENIEIYAPNLLLFKCYDGMPAQSKMRSSMQSKKCLEYYSNDVVPARSFKILRQFLDKHGFKALKLYIFKVFMDDDDKLKMIRSSPFELEHVELQLGYLNNYSLYVAVVDAVFWCCRPQSLSLGFRRFHYYFNFAKWNDLVEHAYKKLLEQQDEGLTNIQIVLSCESKTKKHFSNLNSLLAELPCYEHVQITFIRKKEDTIYN